MADVRKNIDVVIRANDQTRQGVASADAALTTFNKTTLALGISAAGAALGIRTMANEMDQLSKTARQLGTTTREVQQLSYAARIMDVEFTTLTHSVSELQRRLEEPETQIALARIGLRMEDLRDKSPAEALGKVADALKGVESQTIKVSAAYEIFGRQGREVLSALADGSSELNRLMAEAPIIDDDAVKSLGEFGDNLDKMEMNAKAAAATIIGPMVAAVNALADALERGRRAGAWLADRLPWASGSDEWGGRTGHMGRPRMLPGDMEFVPGLGMLPTSRTGAASDVNWPMQDRLRAVQRELRMRSIALGNPGSQIGGAGMRVGGSLRGMDFPGPVGMFPTSAEEEAQNKALEARVGHLADLRDAYDALRDGIQEVEVQGESLGATLVDGAFEWADAWSQGLALMMTKQAEFTDISKRLWRAMITDMISWINRLIARQIVSAILSAFLNRGGGTDIIQAVRNISASGGGSGGEGSYVTFERAARPPAVAMGDFGRNVTLNANISAAFASRSEMQAAAVHLVRYARAELGTA